jgi:hypothetical protein
LRIAGGSKAAEKNNDYHTHSKPFGECERINLPSGKNNILEAPVYAQLPVASAVPVARHATGHPTMARRPATPRPNRALQVTPLARPVTWRFFTTPSRADTRLASHTCQRRT